MISSGQDGTIFLYRNQLAECILVLLQIIRAEVGTIVVEGWAEVGGINFHSSLYYNSIN